MPVSLEGRGLHDILEDALHVPVEVSLRKRSVTHGSGDPFPLRSISGLHKVIARPDSGGGIVLVSPVGHHHPVESPLVPKDRGKKLPALLGILPVQFVVGRHHCPGRRLLDGYLEVLQIDLPEGSLPDEGVILVAVGLLVVEGEMLYRSTHAVGLHSPNIRCSHLSREKRILGEILVITAVERIAVDVLARGQEHVYTIFQGLITDRCGRLLDQRKVPGRGQEGPYRESRGIESIAGPFPGRIDAQAGRAVRENRRRDAEPLYLAGGPGGTPHEVGDAGGDSAGGDGPSPAYAERDLLFESHGLDDFVNVVGGELRLCAHCRRQCRHDGDSKEDKASPEANRSHICSFFAKIMILL